MSIELSPRRSTPIPPPPSLPPPPARPSFRPAAPQRSRSLDHTIPLQFGPGPNDDFFREHGPHDDGGFGHIPSEFLPAEARGNGNADFVGPLLPPEDDNDDLMMSHLAPRPPLVDQQPPPPPVLRPSYEFPSVDFPNLPPPPGFIEATKDMNFDIADVPKLAAKIPYFPPEMVYDAIHGGDESLELLTHNSLGLSTSTTPATRRSDRMMRNPFKSIGDFLGGQSHHDPDGFVPGWDSWRTSNRRMDTEARLTPFSEVEIEHNFGPSKPMSVVPSSRAAYTPERQRIMPSTAPPRFSFGSEGDLMRTQKIEDNISMDFREPVGRITYDTKESDAAAATSASEDGAERPFIPSEEDFFGGLDRPNASEFELQRAEMDKVFDGLKKETMGPPLPPSTSPGTSMPRVIRTTTAPVYVPKRTYVPPERLPPPPPPPQSAVPNPKYLEFDPMAFARRRGPQTGAAEEQNRQARSTDLNPEEDVDLEAVTASERIGRQQRALFGAPSALSEFSSPGAPERGHNHLEQPHQFLHVEGHDKFRAGHHRGNLDHHIQDVQQHHGYSHKEEVSDAWGHGATC